MNVKSMDEKQKGTVEAISMKVLGFLSKYRAVALLLLIAIYIIIFGKLFPHTFLTATNFRKVLLNVSVEFLIVIAMTLILINGEIDLSLGANMVLSGVLCGYMIQSGPKNIFIAIVVVFIMAIGMGLLNGFIISRIGVNSLITTLATGMIYLGIAVWIAGPGFSNFPLQFQAIGQNIFLGLRYPVWYSIVFLIIFSYLISNTRYFRQYYYIGGNLKAAILSGINIKRTKMYVYVIAALLASASGIIAAARFNSAVTSVGGGVELRAVTAAVIGGVSFTGGSGSMAGAAAGALFIALLNNGLIIAGISPYFQNVITGTVLILAIVVDVVIKDKMDKL